MRRLSLSITILTVLLLCNAVVNAQWKQTSGPSLGKISHFFSYGGTLYVSTGMNSPGNVFRSADSGTTWQCISYSLNSSLAFTSVVHDDKYLFASTNAGLFVTSDEGTNWTKRTVVGNISSMAIFTGVLVIAAQNGISTSSDGGATWQLDTIGFPKGIRVNQLRAESDGLYAATSTTGLMQQQAIGSAWADISKTIPDKSRNMYGVAKVGGQLLASTVGCIFSSTNGGATWDSSASGIPAGNGASEFVIVGNSVVAMLQGYGPYRSSNMGKNWIKADSGLSIKGAGAAGVLGQRVFISTQGVYASSDGGMHWHESSSGLGCTNVTCMLPTSDGLLAGDLDNDFGLVWQTQDHGANWASVSKDLSSQGITGLAAGDGVFYCATSGDGVYRSIGHGASWVQCKAGYPAFSYSNGVIARGSFALDATSDYGHSLYRTTNRGLSWDTAYKGLGGAAVNSMIFDGPDVVISVGNFGGLFRSVDEGLNWIAMNSPKEVEMRGLYPWNGDLYLSGALTSYVSRDHGASWQTLSVPSSRRLYCFLNVGASLYAGSDRGVYRSSDSGKSWGLDENSVLDSLIVKSLAYDGTMLYAGTTTAGVWSKPVISSGVPLVGRSQAHKSLVISMSPNPLRESSSISFTLESAGTTRIVIEDEAGRMVRVFSLGELLSGVQKFRLDCSGLSSGEYNLLLESAGGSGSAKLVIAH